MKSHYIQSILPKPVFLLCLILCLQACRQDEVLHTITVAEFAAFVEATGYVTDAEQYGWSIVQKTVYEYEVVEGATWRVPDARREARPNEPVTQVSYNDALAYCDWAGAQMPSYEAYWEAVRGDRRSIIMNNTRMMEATDVNVVGNTWDITTSQNARGEIRLAGGSYLCAPTTCNGTDPDRSLFVSADTGNTHISFSVFRSRN